MRLLDKYTTNKVVSGYLFIFIVFMGIHYVVDIFSHLSDILQTKPALSIILQYYAYMLPLIFLRVSPFSLVISILHSLGELNRHNEIISIRASGLSIFRFALPILVFSLCVSAGALVLQEKVLIVSQKKVEDIKNQFIEKKLPPSSEEKNFAFSSADMIFFARKFYPVQGVMNNVTVFTENAAGEIAKKSIYNTIAYTNGKWIGKDIIEYLIDDDGNIIDRPNHLEKAEVPLTDNPVELQYKKSIYAEFASLKTLRKEIKRLRKVKAVSLLPNLTIEFHQKLVTPLSHFFLVLGILPFALEIRKRRVTLSALGMGFIFCFVYYFLGSFSVALGKSGLLLPIFAAWTPPIFFGTVGVLGFILTR